MIARYLLIQIGIPTIGVIAMVFVIKSQPSPLVFAVAFTVVLSVAIATVLGLLSFSDRKQIAQEATDRSWLNVKAVLTRLYRGRWIGYEEQRMKRHYYVTYRDRHNKRFRAHCRLDWKGSLEWLYVNE
jgi:hypothetical protein